MSYPIKPNFRYLVSTPLIEGAKTLKIELFQVAQFKSMWSMSTREQFSPRLPFRHDDRILFWESAFYRVKITGCWYKDSNQYVFMTKEEAIKKWVL